MKIGGIFVIMISLIVVLGGIDLLPSLTSAVQTLSSDNTTYPELRTLTSITPMVMLVGFVIVAIMLGFGGQAAARYLKWSAFGNRLKEAYAAKFGGENTGFNDEVDIRIKAMRAFGGKSPSKDIAEDWLKRMAAFVEVPWAIPEEEYESEEEKTNNFDDDTEDNELDEEDKIREEVK